MVDRSEKWSLPGPGPIASFSVNPLPRATTRVPQHIGGPPGGPVIGSHLPGMELVLESAASMVTRTEVSTGPEPRMTRHTYSPESAGDTWYSRSREPWV